MGKDIILIKVQSFKYSQYTYYNSCLGAPECSECNPGTNCESEINDLAKPCDVGYECSNSSNPRECLSGTRANETGLTKCLDCPKGYNCFNSKEIYQCEPGRYALHPAKEVCVLCIAGHICTDGVINECGPGRYSSAGSATCNDCQPGEKCIKTTQEKPMDCPIGTGCRRDRPTLKS